MANVTDKVASIRSATYGKDVRESIASGIEAINTESEDTKSRQDVIDSQEQTRINNENVRQSNEAARQTTFNDNETTRQNTFNTNETTRINAFNNNENTRQQAENTRISNEEARQISFSDIEDRFANMEHLDATSEIVTARGSEPTLNDRFVKIEDDISNAESEIVTARGSEPTLNDRFVKIEDDISNAEVVTPTVSYGMNNKITNISKTTTSPKFTIQGKTVINLLGKDGNCEDVSKFGDFQTTHTLDSTNKVFGNNAIKVTTTSTYGSMWKMFNTINIDISKYYCLSAYVKNGNATSVNIAKDATGGGSGIAGDIITDTTKFTRTFIKISPTTMNVGNGIAVKIIGVAGQYAYVDGIMIEEITSTQYNDTNFTPSPYVDSYTCLQNPYVEVKKSNLVRNGSGEEGVAWWNNYATPSSVIIENGYFKITDDDTSYREGLVQNIPIKPNTTYSYRLISKYGTANAHVFIQSYETSAIISENSNSSTTDTTITGTVTTDSLTNNLMIKLTAGDGANNTGIAYFKEIMLTEGTTPPTEYKSCQIQRCVLETKLTSDDSITYENGEVSGEIWWKHKTLFGKDYDWQYNGDGTGFKIVHLLKAVNSVTLDWSEVKYDGKILYKYTTGYNASDIAGLDLSSGFHAICVADTDAGWGESVAPNADEVKAFMNGWKALWNNGTRYLCWISVLDGNYPSNQIQTTTVYSSGGQKVLGVADGSKFVAGDVVLYNRTGGFEQNTIASVSGNNITMVNNLSVNVAAGNTLLKIDDGSTNTSLLNYCKNNVAPNYEGYQLHYKLQNPEIITDYNCHINGDIPTFDVGDNYLYLDSGVVLGEVANPISDGTTYAINNIYNANYALSKLKNKAENMFAVYKNLINNNWNIRIGLGNTYGNVDAIISNTNFDTSATYTVDYKILATQAPQIGSIGCSYSQDIVSVIEDLKEEVNSRQVHDSALDNLVDLSLYEVIIPSVYRALPWWASSGTGIITCQIVIPFKVRKKVIPTINISPIVVKNNSVDITSKIKSIDIASSKDEVVISLSFDYASLSSVLSYGFYLTSSTTVIADCRNRI